MDHAVPRWTGNGDVTIQVGSVFSILLAVMPGTNRPAVAQGRLSDKDLQRLMQNLKDDAQPFRQSFANALKKSTIRKTSQEKDARALADTFAKQANSALETFKHEPEGGAAGEPHWCIPRRRSIRWCIACN